MRERGETMGTMETAKGAGRGEKEKVKAKATKARRRYRTKRRIRQRVIKGLMAAEKELLDVARANGLSLEELAAWATREENVHALEGLARLADVRTQLVMSRYRTAAALRLVALTDAAEGADTARKACVDLLQMDLGAFVKREGDDGPRVPDEKAILRALEEVGRGEGED